MPPIVPPPPDLLAATVPDQSAGNIIQRPGSQTNAEQAALAPSPNAVTSRRLTLYYQYKGDAPVAPTIDADIDIAQPVLNQFAEYAGNRSQINNIPIVGLPVQSVGFKKEQPQAGQQQYINTISNVKDEFDSAVTQFPQIAIRPDALGVSYKPNNEQGPRKRIFVFV